MGRKAKAGLVVYKEDLQALESILERLLSDLRRTMWQLLRPEGGH
jgi:hypothetical protein